MASLGIAQASTTVKVAIQAPTIGVVENLAGAEVEVEASEAVPIVATAIEAVEIMATAIVAAAADALPILRFMEAVVEAVPK